MQAYMIDQLKKAEQKLADVREQCISLALDNETLTPQQYQAVCWQLKPFEIDVGLWQGRVAEMEITSDE